MTQKIIIEYPETMDAVQAIGFAKQRIAQGRISVANDGTPHYCWVSHIKRSCDSGGVIVYTRRKRSPNAADSLVIVEKEFHIHGESGPTC